MSGTVNDISSGGSEPVRPAHRQPQQSSPGGYAIAAFVLGIVSFAACGPCAGIPALILGLMELRNIRNFSASAEGKPFALAGVILGAINSAIAILGLFLYIAFILFIFLSGGFGNWN